MIAFVEQEKEPILSRNWGRWNDWQVLRISGHAFALKLQGYGSNVLLSEVRNLGLVLLCKLNRKTGFFLK